jgi:hypothetical protein
MQHAVLLITVALHEEPAFAAPDRHADESAAEQLGEPAGEPIPAGPGFRISGEQIILGFRPGDCPLIRGVLEPAIRVGDTISV